MKTALLASTLAIGLLFAAQAEAGRADRRQDRQGARIEKGLTSDSINDKEAARLKRRQGRIEKAEQKAMSDGELSGREKAKIEKMQDHQSKSIFRAKHNNNGAAAPQSQLPNPGQSE